MKQNGIVVVGLGPGGGDYLTRQAWEVLSSAEEVYLRTARHPAVADLPAFITQHSFDHLYESADQFNDVYEQIANELLKMGAETQVVYAVPGHPMMGESTVLRVLEGAKNAGIPTQIIAGLSFVEPSLQAVGADGLDGLQIFDALTLAEHEYPPISTDTPALLAQVYNRHMANAIKLGLMALYPEEHQVALLHGAGMPDEIVEWLPLYEMDRSDQISHLTSLFVPALDQASTLPALADTIAVLRSPDGCPWDIQQTSKSMREGFIEEFAEVLEAIDTENEELLQEELGDLLLHILFQAQIASENEAFNIGDVIAGINRKLIRRHPHVWGDTDVTNSDEVVLNWEQIKAKEKTDKPKSDTILKNIPPTLPALAGSQKIQGRVKKVGFDWADISGVWAKLDEEIAEFKTATTPETQHIELGDMLFVIANLAKWHGIQAESALRDANVRFSQRFQKVEQLAKSRNIAISQDNSTQLLALWDEAKLLLKIE